MLLLAAPWFLVAPVRAADTEMPTIGVVVPTVPVPVVLNADNEPDQMVVSWAWSAGMNVIGLEPCFQNMGRGLVHVLSVFATVDRNKIGIIK